MRRAGGRTRVAAVHFAAAEQVAACREAVRPAFSTSYETRYGVLAGARAGAAVAGARVRSIVPPERAALPPCRDDIRWNSSRNGQFAFCRRRLARIRLARSFAGLSSLCFNVVGEQYLAGSSVASV